MDVFPHQFHDFFLVISEFGTQICVFEVPQIFDEVIYDIVRKYALCGIYGPVFLEFIGCPHARVGELLECLGNFLVLVVMDIDA